MKPATSLGAAPRPVQPTDSLAAAARAAMWPQVERLLALEPALRNAEALDELKRYRVATRRLRAALRVFRDALPARASKAVQPELAELARAVGRVRDLDVRIAGLPPGDGLGPLRQAWTAERAAAAAEMGHRLETKRHGRLLDGLVGLVTDDGAGGVGVGREGAGRGPAVRDRAGSATWAAFERLRSAATDLDAGDLAALHDLRIRAKRLRYTLEFLAPVLGTERSALVAALVRLQDHLGELHDADLAAAAAAAFLDAAGTDVTTVERDAIEAYAGAQRATVARLAAGTPKALAPTVSGAFARRLASAILGPAAIPKPGAR